MSGIGNAGIALHFGSMENYTGDSMTKKEIDGKADKMAWFLSATPWPGCPVTMNLVVITEFQEKAVAKFKEFFNKDDIDIQVIIPVGVVQEELVN